MNRAVKESLFLPHLARFRFPCPRTASDKRQIDPIRRDIRADFQRIGAFPSNVRRFESSALANQSVSNASHMKLAQKPREPPSFADMTRYPCVRNSAWKRQFNHLSPRAIFGVSILCPRGR